MKRWGFTGQPASHGVSLTHRSMGSAGGSQGSGSRVHPGKRMAGNMGGEQHTVQNLKVLMVDAPNGIVVVHGNVSFLPLLIALNLLLRFGRGHRLTRCSKPTGAVSGPKGCLVKIQDAIKKPWPEIAPPAAEGTAKEATAA